MKLVIGDVEDEALVQAVGRLRSAGAEVVPVRCDIPQPEEVEQLAFRTIDAFGAVHVVCNNAGVHDASDTSVWEASLADWQWVVGVNFWGVLHGIRTFVPLLLWQDEGYVVNTASAAGLLPAHKPQRRWLRVRIRMSCTFTSCLGLPPVGQTHFSHTNRASLSYAQDTVQGAGSEESMGINGSGPAKSDP